MSAAIVHGGDAHLPPSALALSRLVLGHVSAVDDDRSVTRLVPRGELDSMRRLRERTDSTGPRDEADVIWRKIAPNTEGMLGGG
eukprot:CAMPEP_0119411644 /NCGR_PEP_ID=MMETSP1335-20130426/4322_1 /TAXON_ID=259385 /ORGANISM="Chrysoculter rhomboideus, Strain RCC1486" /LENGTH=83 /DNA_ID=CAMNT_0007436303 /DNA_START=24 /DNA_END=275 /DNA_ORIENTATION=-